MTDPHTPYEHDPFAEERTPQAPTPPAPESQRAFTTRRRTRPNLSDGRLPHVDVCRSLPMVILEF